MSALVWTVLGLAVLAVVGAAVLVWLDRNDML